VRREKRQQKKWLSREAGNKKRTETRPQQSEKRNGDPGAMWKKKNPIKLQGKKGRTKVRRGTNITNGKQGARKRYAVGDKLRRANFRIRNNPGGKKTVLTHQRNKILAMGSNPSGRGQENAKRGTQP